MTNRGVELLIYDNIEEIVAHLQHCKHVMIISPGPAKSDAAAAFFENHGINHHSVTISRFMSKCLEKCFGSQHLHEIKLDKASLMMNLYEVWFDAGFTDNFYSFEQVFNQLTQLRSYTVDYRLIVENGILEQFPPLIQKGIDIFWQAMAKNNIIDEHGSYFLLDHYLGHNDIDLEIRSDALVFWGFDYLSGTQIDLLKTLGKNFQVVIPVSSYVYHHCSDRDWPKWIDTKFSKKEVDPPCINATLYTFPKGRLAQYLSIVKQELLPVMQERMILPVKDMNLSQAQEVCLEDYFFRSSVNILQDSMDSLLEKIESFVGLFSCEKIKLEIKNSWVPDFIVKQDFKKLKCVEILLELLNSWPRFKESQSFLRFDFQFLSYLAGLKLTRNFILPEKSNPSFQILDLNQWDMNFSGRNIICFRSDYNGLSFGQDRLPPKIYEFVSAIAPIKNEEYDFLVLYDKIRSLLACDQTIVLLEQDSWENSHLTKRIFSDYLLSMKSMNSMKSTSKEERKVDYIESHIQSSSKDKFKLTKWSQSQFQSYINCPRSFYFKYIGPVKTDSVYPSTLTPAQMGLIEHEIIARFYQERVKDQQLSSFIELVLNSFLKENKISLDAVDLKRAMLELTQTTTSGIHFLKKVQSVFEDAQFEFETLWECDRSIPGLGHQVKFYGRLDCIIRSSQFNAIIDFKRSKSGIATLNEYKNLEKIQLSFYRSLVNDRLDVNVLGHICLSEPVQSWFVSNQDDLVSVFNEMVQSENGKIKEKLVDFEEISQRFDLLVESIVFEVNEKKVNSYPATADQRICQYCKIAPICSKGIADEMSQS